MRSSSASEIILSRPWLHKEQQRQLSRKLVIITQYPKYNVS